MTPMTFLLIAFAYVGILFIIAHFTGEKSKSSDFYLAGKVAPWYIVAFGMIGATLSGVTFISVPGWVGSQNWTFIQKWKSPMQTQQSIGLRNLPKKPMPIHRVWK